MVLSDQFIALPESVSLAEVAFRDGLQSEHQFIATEDKIRLIDQMSRTGIEKIEVTAFVSPKAVPVLSDAMEVMNGIVRIPEVIYSALVPNAKGAERAIAANSDELNVVISVSELHNLANIRMTCEQSLAQIYQICALSAKAGTPVNASLSTAFGCPFGGWQPMERVISLAEQLISSGVHSLTLADTTGMANPTQVYQLCRAIRARFPQLEITLHFHNTRGLGLSNVLAALAAGITQFDASLAGIGGCPFAPGATGNICTEDLINLLQSSGINCSADLDAVIQCSHSLAALLDKPVPGQLLYAGKATELKPVPESVKEMLAAS